MSRLYLSPEKRDHAATWRIVRIMYGGQTDEYDFRKIGFDWQFLRRAGFKDIERVGEHALFDDTSAMRIEDQLISLNVKARK